MLAPNYRTATELGLTPTQRDALIKVLGQLERGELHELDASTELHGRSHQENDFSMRGWATCICGHAKRYAEFDSAAVSQSGPMGSLFYRTSMTMAQATDALRDYLCGSGDADATCG
jgi:hypothetical protein